jgi:hypothetical protein
MSSELQKPAPVIDYERQMPGTSQVVAQCTLVGTGLCVAIFFGSIWAGNAFPTGEDLGWFRYPALFAFVGFFVIPFRWDGFGAT